MLVAEQQNEKLVPVFSFTNPHQLFSQKEKRAQFELLADVRIALQKTISRLVSDSERKIKSFVLSPSLDHIFFEGRLACRSSWPRSDRFSDEEV